MKCSKRIGLGAILALTAGFASAEIRYTVHLAADNTLLVDVDAPVKAGTSDIAFQMPRWAPGGYAYGDYGKEVTAVSVKDKAGHTLAFDHPDFSTWKVASPPAGDVIISYTVKPEVTEGVLHFSGPSTYMYVVGRKEEGCKVTLDLPSDWPIAVGLNASKGSKNTFVAPTYDVLADNPVSAGKYFADGYTVAGKKHFIALRGAAADVAAIDKTKMHNVTRFVSAMETNFFGGAPYDHYVWHFTAFNRPDGGWGLEHLSSTQIGLATGFGPGTDGVIAHEFFHLWNVKRIRSKPLGPFNYQELPQTGALWWLEGVTDYYAHLLLRRYGWTDDERLYKVISQQVAAVRGNPAHLEVSPYEASYRVREANNGRGNSNGYKISYYNDGWLVGLCLDMAVRNATNNRKSLDDVERTLFKKYGHGQPGFEEGAIRDELVNVAGPSLGAFYDEVVMKPGDMPLEEALGRIGLVLEMKDQTYGKFPFAYDMSAERGGLVLHDVEASATGLKNGDLVVGIDGQDFAALSRMQAFQLISSKFNNPDVGKTIALKIKRDGVADALTVSVTSGEATRKAYVVSANPAATEAQLALRKAWLTPPSNWVAPK